MLPDTCQGSSYGLIMSRTTAGAAGKEQNMTSYQRVREDLQQHPRNWIVTGAAGFIGSGLLEELLNLGQNVTGLDNFSSGKEENLEDVRRAVGEERWRHFTLIRGDIRDMSDCRAACRDAHVMLHQAALGSVPRSVEDPIECNEINVNGTLNIFKAACDMHIPRVVYATSSAVYGDCPGHPKIEEKNGRPLSPYAVSKQVNELYADVFSKLYGLESIGLRYFNVFGPRQDPDGAYAAVIPRWISAMSRNEKVYINGTGETSRDFCYLANIVQINLLAATTTNRVALNQVYNAALNRRTSLNELYRKLQKRLTPHFGHVAGLDPVHRDFRVGDIMHSQADIHKARYLLGYSPTHTVDRGLDDALLWYIRNIC